MARIVGVLIFLLFCGLAVQMCTSASHSESQAQELCHSFHVGDNATMALNAMQKSGAHFFANEKEGYARFPGFGAAYIVCHIDYSNNKITKVDVAQRN